MRPIAAIIIALGLVLPQPLGALTDGAPAIGVGLGDDEHPLLIAPAAGPCVVIGRAVTRSAGVSAAAIERSILIGLSILFGLGFALYYVGSWAHCQDLALCAAMQERARIRNRLLRDRHQLDPWNMAQRVHTRVWLSVGQSPPFPLHLSSAGTHSGMATHAL